MLRDLLTWHRLIIDQGGLDIDSGGYLQTWVLRRKYDSVFSDIVAPGRGFWDRSTAAAFDDVLEDRHLQLIAN